MAEQNDGWWAGSGFFCATPTCQLHVTVNGVGVQGYGHWAVIDGIVYDRHPMDLDGPVFCSACRKAMAEATDRVAAMAA